MVRPDSIPQTPLRLLVNFRYLAGTEEGHIHKCSCSYNEQFLESYHGHTVSNYFVRLWSHLHFGFACKILCEHVQNKNKIPAHGVHVWIENALVARATLPRAQRQSSTTTTTT